MPQPTEIDTAGGGILRIHPAEGAERARILAFHGGGGVGGTPVMLDALAAAICAGGGISFCAASYPTLDTAPGTGFDDIRAAARTALDAARADMAPGAGLYLLGASFGGLMALDLAIEGAGELAGLILLNPVTDTGPGGFANRMIDPARHAALSPMARVPDAPDVTALPCLIAQGLADSVVPAEVTRRFAAHWPAALMHLTEVPGAPHGFFNTGPHTDDTAHDIRAFLKLSSAAKVPVPAEKPARLPGALTLLFGIGAQKSGTSWLYDYLSQSPDVHMPELKELHYFDVLNAPGETGHMERQIEMLIEDSARIEPHAGPANLRHLRKIGIRARHLEIYTGKPGDHRPYLRYLTRGRGQARILCDITPAYATLTADAFADMAALGPGTRFLFMMREPAERVWSQVRMDMRAKHSGIAGPQLTRACINEIRRMDRDGRLARAPRLDYARTIRELERAVPADRIHYVFHEPVFSMATAAGICAFLGIDPPPLPKGETPEKVSIPEEIEPMMVKAMAAQYDFVADRFGDAMPESWRARRARIAPAGAPADPVSASLANALPHRIKRLGRRLIPRRAPATTGKDGADLPTIAFMHIPKTAGQTIVSEIRRVVGEANTSPVRTHTEVAPDAQMPPGYRFHGGHIDWVDLETLPENRFAFTVLREPRERIASFYFYLLREAGKLTPEELQKGENTGKRIISTGSADDYFFGGNPGWQRFVRDHYDNFYCSYLITRRMRGWKQIEALDPDTLVAKALEGAEALDGIYSVDTLDALETDLGKVLGQPVHLSGNYKNAGPDAGRRKRWPELVALFEDPANAERLEAFAVADEELMRRLGMMPGDTHGR